MDGVALPQLPPIFRRGVRRYVAHKPTPPQTAFLLYFGDEAFFGGAAGGGKSDALLMAALQYADVPDYAAVLVRKSYPMLVQPGGLIERSHGWLGPTDAEWNGAEHQWRFPSGATLTFRHLSEAGAELNFQGAEYQFFGIDEVTEIREDQYRFLFSRLRRLRGSEVPTRMRATSNPWGPGLEWCRRWFITERAPGRVFIPAKLEDNPHLDREDYERKLRQLGLLQYRALRHGDWTVTPEGGLFEREWFEDRFLEDAELPKRLRLCRYWDLAATEARKGNDPDHTVGLLLGRSDDTQWYVADVRRIRSTPLKVEQLVEQVADRDAAWASERGLLRPVIRMEQEPGSAGVTVIDHYRRKLARFDFKGIPATGPKEARADLVAARAEARELWICRGRWNTAFLDEIVSFPVGGHDDQVDALSGAYAFLAEHPVVASGSPIGVGWHPSYWKGGWSAPASLAR